MRGYCCGILACMCSLQCAPVCPRPRPCWRAIAFLLCHPSDRRGHPRSSAVAPSVRPSVRPPAAAPPAVQFYFCPRATPSAFSCFAHEADAYMHVADAYMHVDDARVGLA